LLLWKTLLDGAIALEEEPELSADGIESVGSFVWDRKQWT